MDTSDILNAISEQRNAALNQAAIVSAQLVAAGKRIKELEDRVNELKLRVENLPAVEDGA